MGSMPEVNFKNSEPIEGSSSGQAQEVNHIMPELTFVKTHCLYRARIQWVSAGGVPHHAGAAFCQNPGPIERGSSGKGHGGVPHHAGPEFF